MLQQIHDPRAACCSRYTTQEQHGAASAILVLGRAQATVGGWNAINQAELQDECWYERREVELLHKGWHDVSCGGPPDAAGKGMGAAWYAVQGLSLRQGGNTMLPRLDLPPSVSVLVLVLSEMGHERAGPVRPTQVMEPDHPGNVEP
eukprot:356345-Chlamydomonas_euryale.AAC.8